jgi:hypothetical protein
MSVVSYVQVCVFSHILFRSNSSTGKAPSTSALNVQRFHPYARDPTPPVDNSLPISELQSSPLLDYLGYRFHRRYHTLICVSCEVARFPDAALGHAKISHLINIKSVDKEAWNKMLSDWDVTTSTKIPPPMDRQAVELLRIHPDAYCCNFCNHCVLTSKSFSNHWSSAHAALGYPVNERFHRGYVQTFYTPVHISYFEIDPPEVQTTTPGIFNIYLKELPAHSPFPVLIPKNAREIPPLLFQTQWHDHLEGYLKDKKKRLSLLTLVNPVQIAKTPLWKLVWNYSMAVSQLGKGSSMRIRCMLSDYPA